MGVLLRIVEFFSGIAVTFAGYFIMSAVGWPEPIQSMVIERRVIGGLIVALGLALIWSAFKPKPKARAKPAPAPRPADAAPSPDVADQPHGEPAATETAVASEDVPSPPLPVATGSLAALLAEGDRLFAEGRGGEALDPYAQAVHLARQAHETNPQDAEATRALAGALKSNADAYDEEGRLDTAIDYYEEALNLNRALASSGSAADQRRLSLVLERLADCREARGHRSRAIDLYRESLDIAEGLARSDPDNSLYADDLAVTRRRLAELQSESAPA